MIQVQNNKKILCTWCSKYAVRVIEETELVSGSVRVTLTQYACEDHMNRPSVVTPSDVLISNMSDETLEKAAWLYLRKALPSGTVPDGMRIHDAVSMLRQQMYRREQALRKLEQTAAARAADTSPPVPKKSRRE